jgi:hypothetical protein
VGCRELARMRGEATGQFRVCHLWGDENGFAGLILCA